MVNMCRAVPAPAVSLRKVHTKFDIAWTYPAGAGAPALVAAGLPRAG